MLQIPNTHYYRNWGQHDNRRKMITNKSIFWSICSVYFHQQDTVFCFQTYHAGAVYVNPYADTRKSRTLKLQLTWKYDICDNSPSKWLRNSLVTGSRTFHNDDEGHRICMVITLIMVEDSKAWSGWHGDNPITTLRRQILYVVSQFYNYLKDITRIFKEGSTLYVRLIHKRSIFIVL